MARRWLSVSRPSALLSRQWTDLFANLFRLAFISAFLSALYLLDFVWLQTWLVQVIIILAALFTVVSLLLLFLNRDIRRLRFPSVVLDLVLVSAAVYTTAKQMPAYLAQMYYLIVLEAAHWDRARGALVTALGAALCYGVVQMALADSLVDVQPLARETAGIIPFLMIVALVAGYLEESRQRESRELTRMRNEMSIFRTLQDMLLPPSHPDIRRWLVALHLETARKVGGDLYILEALADGRYLVCLGDVSGKSLQGLIYLYLILSHTRVAAREGHSPRAIAKQVNAHVYDTLPPETYASLLIGLLDPGTGVIDFANCGHLPPLIASRATGEVRPLKLRGTVIGAARDPQCDEVALQLRVGEMLVMYTDGVSEARNQQREEFGEERVAQAVRVGLSEGLSPDRLASRLLATAEAWAAHPRADDATCLVLEWLGNPPGR